MGGLTRLAQDALLSGREDLARLALHRRHLAQLELGKSAAQPESLDRIERLVKASLRELTAILTSPASADGQLRLELDPAIEIELQSLMSREQRKR